MKNKSASPVPLSEPLWTLVEALAAEGPVSHNCRASVSDASPVQFDWRFTETPYKSVFELLPWRHFRCLVLVISLTCTT